MSKVCCQEHRNIPLCIVWSLVCGARSIDAGSSCTRLSGKLPTDKSQEPLEEGGAERKGGRTETGGQDGTMYVLESVLGTL